MNINFRAGNWGPWFPRGTHGWTSGVHGPWNFMRGHTCALFRVHGIPRVSEWSVTPKMYKQKYPILSSRH